MRSVVTILIEVIFLVSILYVASGRITDVSQVDSVLQYLNPSSAPKPFGRYCQCAKKYSCGCCAHFTWKDLKLINAVACVNVSYLPDQFGFSLVLTLNNKVLFNETVSAKNPPPICYAVPFLKKDLSLCVDLYNIDVTKQYVSGCIKLEAHVLHITVETVHLGCYRIPLYSIAAQQNAAAIVKAIQAARLKKGIYYK